MRHLSTGHYGVFAIAVLLMLALSGNADAATEADATETGRSGGDIYGIVNLAPPTSYIGFVNARGQAAFEYLGPDDRTQVRSSMAIALSISVLQAMSVRLSAA